MSRTRIVGGNITRITGGNYKIFSKENIEIHSNKQIIQTGEESGVSFGAPQSPPVVARISSNCVVEFRTKQDGTYIGQFGFDWLRVDDNTLTREAKYYDCLVNGYEAPNGRAPHRDANTQYETKDEAYKALKKEYKNIPVRVPVTTPVTPPKDYFVPYLNLFSKPFSDAATVPTGIPPPPFEAELRTLIEVGGTDEPDQVRVVFDKRYFTVNGSNGDDANPVLLDKTIGAKREAATITIKCIADFDSNQEIKVYNYPKGTLARPLPEQLAKRELAGKIIVGANKNTTGQGAVKNVKTQKIVLVQLWTDILSTGRITKGAISRMEKDNLQNALYQALIFGDIKDKDSTRADIVLNVSNDINFQTGGKYIANGGILRTEPTLNSYMRTLLNASTANIYTDCFYVFVFEVNDSTNNVGGRVEDIGLKSVVLYKGRDNFTLNHEVLHGLSLYHTHADGAISKPNQKFIYPHASVDALKATDNIMSYQPDGKTSWRWQWKIIRKNV
jgi:hypothetical protein